jgi:hypothetical protein
LTRAYYVLLRKALPALRLSLTRVGYDGSVSPLIGGGVFDQLLPATFLLLLLRAKSDLVANNSTREGDWPLLVGNQLRAPPSTIPLRRTRSASNGRGAPVRRCRGRFPGWITTKVAAASLRVTKKGKVRKLGRVGEKCIGVHRRRTSFGCSKQPLSQALIQPLKHMYWHKNKINRTDLRADNYR